jgi:hypothetical protein
MLRFFCCISRIVQFISLLKDQKGGQHAPFFLSYLPAGNAAHFIISFESHFKGVNMLRFLC